MFAIPKSYLCVGTALLLATGYLWWHHHVYSAGDATGYARGHLELENSRGTIQRITQQRETENAVKAAQVQATNEITLHAYQSQLAAIADGRDSLARQLRVYRNQAGACSAILPPVEDRPGTDAASTLPGGAQSVDELLDQLDKACAADSAQLTALQAELLPQLSSAPQSPQ